MKKINKDTKASAFVSGIGEDGDDGLVVTV